MKAVVIHEAGGPEKLILQDVPTPSTIPRSSPGKASRPAWVFREFWALNASGRLPRAPHLP